LNIQHDHARDCGLAIRVFDSFASKTLLVIHEISRTALTSLGFVENEDYISYSSLNDLKDKCTFFAKNDYERERITESAYKKLISAHTLRHRMSSVFAKAGFVNIAAHLSALTDENIMSQLISENVFCLDEFPQEEKLGKDYSPLLEEETFTFNSHLAPGELAMQFDNSRIVLPLYSISMPKILKLMTKQIVKYTVQITYGLARLCKWPISLMKVPD
jgi:hypothetical protein